MRRRRAGPLAGAVLCLAPLVASGASARAAAAQGVRPSQLTPQTRLRVHEPEAERPVDGTFVYYRPGRLTYLPDGAHDPRSVDPGAVRVDVGRWEGRGNGLFVLAGAAAGGLLGWSVMRGVWDMRFYAPPASPYLGAIVGGTLGAVVAAAAMPDAGLVWEPLTVGSQGADSGEGAEMEVVAAQAARGLDASNGLHVGAVVGGVAGLAWAATAGQLKRTEGPLEAIGFLGVRVGVGLAAGALIGWQLGGRGRESAWRPVMAPSPVAPGVTDVGVRWAVR